MFIGRETELKFLEDKYHEKKAQLIVLYGRRRVGKTETLREFCKGKPHIFFSCTQSTDKDVYKRQVRFGLSGHEIPFSLAAFKTLLTVFLDTPQLSAMFV